MRKFQYISRFILVVILVSQMIFSPQVVQALDRAVFVEELDLASEKNMDVTTTRKKSAEEPFGQKINSESNKEELKTNQEYKVELSGPANLSVSSNGTYEIMVKSMATPQNTLDDVVLNVYIPEGYEYDEVVQNSYIMESNYDSDQRLLTIKLNNLAQAVVNFSFTVTHVDDAAKYPNIEKTFFVKGTSTPLGNTPSDETITKIIGDIDYKVNKSYSVPPASNNRTVTYAFNIVSEGEPLNQFITKSQKITDKLPIGVEIISTNDSSGIWEISGDSSTGIEAVWSRNADYGPNSTLLGDQPSITVNYPKENFPDYTKPPTNTAELSLIDKDNQNYDGKPGNVQSLGFLPTSGSTLGIEKKASDGSGNSPWYSGTWSRKFGISGSYGTNTVDKIKELTITDSAYEYSNQEFWNHVNLYLLNVSFNSVLQVEDLPYTVEYQTTENDTWHVGASGTTANNTQFAFATIGSINWQNAAYKIFLPKDEIIAGFRVKVGDKNGEAKIPPTSQIDVDTFLIPIYKDFKTKIGDGEKDYQNTAAISGVDEDGRDINPATAVFEKKIKDSVPIATTVKAPSSFKTGDSVYYTAYINNLSPTDSYNEGRMKVVLPTGVFLDTTKTIERVSAYLPAPYLDIEIPKIGKGVSVTTDFIGGQNETEPVQQVVCFNFNPPLPLTRGAGLASDRWAEGFGYTIPVTITNSAYKANKTGAKVESWAYIEDPLYDQVPNANFRTYITDDSNDFDLNRDKIAYSSANSQVQSSGGLLLTKLSKADSDLEYQIDSQLEVGEQGSWKLLIENTLAGTVTDLKLFDKLPQAEFETKLAGPIISSNTNVKIEYSSNASDYDTGDWTNNWKDATAFRISLDQLEIDSSLKIIVPTKIPSSARANQKIKNSFSTSLSFNNKNISFVSNEASMAVKNFPGKILLEKIDKDTKNTLQGAVFELQNKNGEIVQSNLMTNESGELVVNGLAPGDYQFIEQKAPVGYELDQTPLTFTIEKGQTVASKISAVNKRTKGSILLEKVDEDTKQPLSGAVFELQDENHQVIEKNMITDQTGRLVINDLSPGIYYVVETSAPKGYTLNNEPIRFEVNDKTHPEQVITITNKAKNYALRVIKKDKQDDAVLSGAVFNVYDSKGTLIQKNLKTDKNGVFTLENLKEGQYQLKEITPPKGYQIDTKPIDFTIREGNRTVSINVYNSRLESADAVQNQSTSSTQLPETGEQKSFCLIFMELTIILLGGTVMIRKNSKKNKL
ncbi:hypothetical protein ABID30_001925 [Enterococcus rotai]|uniref:SpaA-like prealbumin fold domain-containing protein n=1 Tax=Enterococcus rotai TaxID=118060 RepID=A0A0U2WXV0_9ENTE|nr:SpaA isopeptide-forming pilin-related protein [Enterococcus rotai]ALS36874.1 hypothetical protein ATZ35_06800 [Enterococcus rotai]